MLPGQRLRGLEEITPALVTQHWEQINREKITPLGVPEMITSSTFKVLIIVLMSILPQAPVCPGAPLTAPGGVIIAGVKQEPGVPGIVIG